MRSKILIALSFMLAACSPGGESKTEAAGPAPVYSIDLSAPSQFVVPQGVPTIVTAIDGGVRFAGHLDLPPREEAPFMTQGAALRIPQEFERAVGGHRIRVTLRARSLDGATSFSSAYSTNDVGNSRWRDLPLTSQYNDVSYEFSVLPPNRGADDFIGINPPVSGSVDIASIRIDLVEGDTLRQ